MGVGFSGGRGSEIEEKMVFSSRYEIGFRNERFFISSTDTMQVQQIV